MHTGTLPSAQVDKIDVTGVTGVDAPVNTDQTSFHARAPPMGVSSGALARREMPHRGCAQEKYGADLLRQLALNKNYTAMELRNPKPGPVLRQFSEGQLLKEKDKSVWSRFFGL